MFISLLLRKLDYIELMLTNLVRDSAHYLKTLYPQPDAKIQGLLNFSGKNKEAGMPRIAPLAKALHATNPVVAIGFTTDRWKLPCLFDWAIEKRSICFSLPVTKTQGAWVSKEVVKIRKAGYQAVETAQAAYDSATTQQEITSE